MSEWHQGAPRPRPSRGIRRIGELSRRWRRWLSGMKGRRSDYPKGSVIRLGRIGVLKNLLQEQSIAGNALNRHDQEALQMRRKYSDEPIDSFRCSEDPVSIDPGRQ